MFLVSGPKVGSGRALSIRSAGATRTRARRAIAVIRWFCRVYTGSSEFCHFRDRSHGFDVLLHVACLLAADEDTTCLARFVNFQALRPRPRTPRPVTRARLRRNWLRGDPACLSFREDSYPSRDTSTALHTQIGYSITEVAECRCCDGAERDEAVLGTIATGKRTFSSMAPTIVLDSAHRAERPGACSLRLGIRKRRTRTGRRSTPDC